MKSKGKWSRLILLIPAFLISTFFAYEAKNKLGMTSDHKYFTINEKPAFLLGISYYQPLVLNTSDPATKNKLIQDLNEIKNRGFNWIRVWAMWSDNQWDVHDPLKDYSVLKMIDSQNIDYQEPYWTRLKTLIELCDDLGIIVDVTYEIQNENQHHLFSEKIADGLKDYQNVYFDVWNEFDSHHPEIQFGDKIRIIRESIDIIKRCDPDRLCTASAGYPTESFLSIQRNNAHVDFVAPHVGFIPGDDLTQMVNMMNEMGLRCPVHLQEPSRRGRVLDVRHYWGEDHFLNSLSGAANNDAAGWCFHNGIGCDYSGTGNPNDPEHYYDCSPSEEIPRSFYLNWFPNDADIRCECGKQLNTGLLFVGRKIGVILETGQLDTIERNVANNVKDQLPTLKLCSPNEGEVWIKGNSYEISWVHSGLSGNLQIGLYKGNTLEREIGIVNVEDGKYTWRIPDDLSVGRDYKVLIYWYMLGREFSDFSDVPFTITDSHGSITLISPNGGEKLVRGREYEITWTQSNLPYDNVYIELYSGNERFSYIGKAPATAGRFTWTIDPEEWIGTDYRVKIFQGSCSDYSDRSFSISGQNGCSITVINPAPAETVRLNSTYRIRWDHYSCVETGRLFLYKDGRWVNDLANFYWLDEGLCDWLVSTDYYGNPLVPGSGYTIQFVTDDDHRVVGESSVFSIADLTPIYTISATAGTGGVITPVGNVTVKQGANQTFSIAANGGYIIQDVTIDGASQGSISSYSFNNIQTNHAIAASFSPSATFAITASAGAGGAISPSGVISVPFGGDQTFCFTPDASHTILDVKIDGVSQGAIACYTFTNIINNHTIEVIFKIKTFTVTVDVHGGEGWVLPGWVNYWVYTMDYGSSISWEFVPANGYTGDYLRINFIFQWFPADNKLTLTNITENKYVEVFFREIWW